MHNTCVTILNTVWNQYCPPDMLTYAHNPSIWEVEAEWLWIKNRLGYTCKCGLHSEIYQQSSSHPKYTAKRKGGGRNKRKTQFNDDNNKNPAFPFPLLLNLLNIFLFNYICFLKFRNFSTFYFFTPIFHQ